jgi:hypothetical protein
LVSLKAICKLIYSRFDFSDGIDFTVGELKRAVNALGPVASKISQGNHAIARLQVRELRWKDFVNVAKRTSRASQ